MLETKELNVETRPTSGRRLAISLRPMSALNLFLSRLNGWALSLLLHGGVAALAALAPVGAACNSGDDDGGGGAPERVTTTRVQVVEGVGRRGAG